jgi:hypothetical protein
LALRDLAVGLRSGFEGQRSHTGLITGEGLRVLLVLAFKAIALA